MDYVIVDVICVNMPVLTSEDKALIKVLRVENGGNVDRTMREFPARQWKRRTLYDLVRKIDQTDRLTGNGRPRSVHTAAKSRTANTFPVTLRRIFNNRLKKLSFIVFCRNF